MNHTPNHSTALPDASIFESDVCCSWPAFARLVNRRPWVQFHFVSSFFFFLHKMQLMDHHSLVTLTAAFSESLKWITVPLMLNHAKSHDVAVRIIPLSRLLRIQSCLNHERSAMRNTDLPPGNPSFFLCFLSSVGADNIIYYAMRLAC